MIEMMITVAIIGILAAVSIPAFQNYQNRSRRAESFTNLAAVAKLEKGYFAEYSAYTQSIVAQPGGVPTSAKQTWDPASEVAFGVLGFRPDGAVFYTYDVNVDIAQCPLRDCFTASAYGDADGNLALAVVMYVQPDASGLAWSLSALEPGVGLPLDPISSQPRFNEVAVNYVADLYYAAKAAASLLPIGAAVANSSIRLLLLSIALCATWVAHARIPAPETQSLAGTSASADGISAKPLSFGFDTLVADYRWLQAVQLVGHENADLAGAAPAIQQLVGSVVALDPYVDHPYRFASLWLVNDADQVRAANEILERGIAYHPDEWRNRFYLSFNHFFYLGDTEAATRELERAVELEGSPRYLGRLLARLRAGGGGLDAAGAYLEELVQQTDDPWKRADYEKALDEIETERRAR
jgi:hypothetical protein